MKNINFNLVILAVIVICLALIFTNVYKIRERMSAAGALTVIDNFLKANKENSAENSSISNTEIANTTEISSNSKFDTMVDRYGNKTQTRCFDSHPRVRCVVIITKAGGEQQVSVYGQDGTVRNLPENMLSRVATATADEIANSAGIFVVKQEAVKPIFIQTNQPKIETQPDQISQTATQNQLSQSTQSSQTVETKVNNSDKSTTENNVTVKLNSKPEDK